MAGSDGPEPYVLPGFSLHTELEWLVKSGFSPTQALQSATFNPAHLISVRREWELEQLRVRTLPEVLELAKKESARELELVNSMRRAGIQALPPRMVCCSGIFVPRSKAARELENV